MEVKIPFKEQFRDVMVNGTKTMTCRTKQYGKRGDTFPAFGQAFEILKVERRTLEDVQENYWREEGCTSPEHFEKVWISLHIRKGFKAMQRVYAHIFRRISI